MKLRYEINLKHINSEQISYNPITSLIIDNNSNVFGTSKGNLIFENNNFECQITNSTIFDIIQFNDKIIIASDKLYVYDIENEIKSEILGHSKSVGVLKNFNDKIYSGGKDGKINLNDLRVKKKILSLKSNFNLVNDFDVIENYVFGTGSPGGLFSLWDLRYYSRGVVQPFNVNLGNLGIIAIKAFENYNICVMNNGKILKMGSCGKIGENIAFLKNFSCFKGEIFFINEFDCFFVPCKNGINVVDYFGTKKIENIGLNNIKIFKNFVYACDDGGFFKKFRIEVKRTYSND
ncbi:hypothetical protein GVAV_002161 [Gurleya vavrai]